MNTPSSGPKLPPEILAKLEAVRKHDRRVRIQSGLLRGGAILLVALLVAMAIDWAVVFYEHGARWALTFSALACASVGVAIWGLIPMFRGRSMDRVAGEVDRAHPALQERYQTVAGLSANKDTQVMRGSESLLRKVTEQATALSNQVTPDAVVSTAAVSQGLRFFGVAAGALALLFAVNFTQSKILLQRLLLPGADFSLTQVESKTGDTMIGKGESVTLEFTSTGLVKDSATLFIKSAAGNHETIPLQRSTETNATFVYTESAVGDSFDYRVRSGDGQTRWHHVTVLERPKLTQVQLRVSPPAYSRLPVIDEKTLPHQVRALEGSKLEVSFQADQPLASLELKFADGRIQPVTESGNIYKFEAVLTNSFAFEALLRNTRKMENLDRPSCEVIVYRDEAPSVAVKSPDDQITARPDDKVKIEFEAQDDFGLAKAELEVSLHDGTNTTTVTIPIPLENETGARHVKKEVELDLAKLNAKQDQELSYVVRVTDTKDNLSSGSKQNGSQSKESKDSKSANSQNQMAENQQEKETSSSSNQVAQASNPSENSQDQNKESQNQSKESQNQSSNLAAKNQPKNDQERPPSEGSQPPPNDMTKRALDVAQSSTCEPMRILVDEWSRSFEGQQREKLEIAIEPVLKQLDELLAKAQGLTDDTLAIGKSAKGLSAAQNAPLETARGNLRECDSVITDLKTRTHDTPYAFIGLQLHDIREMHITPARQKLVAVVLEAAKLQEELTHLQSASFQIQQARQKLADLTKSYDNVKRDFKVADAMQRLQKMHQIFLEDTQEMLGSSKPALNSYQRKVAEVDDEFAEKLQKLLEEKKKIMEELARLLAEDPRMLRRFLAMQQLEGTSLRDQMTLLALRQQVLTKQVGDWSAAEEKDREPLKQQLLSAQAADQAEVAALAAKLNENMITWVPLDVSTNSTDVAECQALAAEATRLATEAAGQTKPETLDAGLASANKSLELIRQLHARLPLLEHSEWSNPKLGLFAANRMSETAVLVTRESGWIKKIEAVRAGDIAQAVEVDQHRLTAETSELATKLDTASIGFSRLSPEINAKAIELNATVNGKIIPEQTDATDALAKKSVKQAAPHQVEASTAFATAEKQFDELLKLIIAKLDEAPPPTQVGQSGSLEDLLAMLQEEQKAAEALGIPNRPINVSVMKDWMKPGSNPGQGQGQSQAQAQARNQARMAQAKARNSQQRADRVRDSSRQAAKERATELAGPTTGPQKASRSWNTVVSQLGDELRQGRDNVPPEQYRGAIESYFNVLAEKMPLTPADSTQK